jgi:hypothetical protein
MAGVIARATAKKRSTRQEFRSSIETPLVLSERSVELQNLWIVWSCCMDLLTAAASHHASMAAGSVKRRACPRSARASRLQSEQEELAKNNRAAPGLGKSTKIVRPLGKRLHAEEW